MVNLKTFENAKHFYIIFFELLSPLAGGCSFSVAQLRFLSIFLKKNTIVLDVGGGGVKCSFKSFPMVSS